MKGGREIVLGALVGSILLLGGCASANVPMHETSKSQESKAESETQTLAGEESNVRRIYEYDSQELYVQRGENQIYGILYIPKDAGRDIFPRLWRKLSGRSAVCTGAGKERICGILL